MPRWNEVETEYVTDRYVALTNKEMAEKLDRSEAAVASKLHSMGLNRGNWKAKRKALDNFGGKGIKVFEKVVGLD